MRITPAFSTTGGHKYMIVWLPEYLRPDTANTLLKTLEEPPEGTLFIFVSNSIERILATVQSRVQILPIPKLTDEDIKSELMASLANFERVSISVFIT
jgi:DNA polymerase-3 subunit delta'